ncbi:hypothetical protein [Phenylobacterium sp.]|uniref:hypothetical protein n=1 Tax=Phenylobacterium sp. TaxID=1871053 RepID=UPI00289AEEF7|nr:hypothetical protein [Phenylobacterium sp.]
MRVTIVTQASTADEPVKAVVEFEHDSEALSELWRLLASARGRPGLLDVNWERSDGAIVRREALLRWAAER